MRKSKPWTKEEISALMKSADGSSTVPIKSLARRFGRSLGAAYRRIHRERVNRGHIPNDRGPLWSSEEDAALIWWERCKAKPQGERLTMREVADSIGRSLNSCYHRVDDLRKLGRIGKFKKRPRDKRPRAGAKVNPSAETDV